MYNVSHKKVHYFFLFTLRCVCIKFTPTNLEFEWWFIAKYSRNIQKGTVGLAVNRLKYYRGIIIWLPLLEKRQLTTTVMLNRHETLKTCFDSLCLIVNFSGYNQENFYKDTFSMARVQFSKKVFANNHACLHMILIRVYRVY